MLLRSDESEAVNLIGWSRIKNDRRACSTLAAETQAMEFVMDRAIGMKSLFQELGLDRSQTTVMTDNLSLKKVIYSGREAQEVRVRSEIGIIRDLMMTDEIDVRFVPTEKMTVDDLTKSDRNSGNRVRDICLSNCLEKHKDAEGKNPGDMRQAEKDIWLLAEEEEEEEVQAYSAESSVMEVGGPAAVADMESKAIVRIDPHIGPTVPSWPEDIVVPRLSGRRSRRNRASNEN